MKTIPAGLLDELVRRLVAEFDPEQIILFGSHAWGTPDDDSDIDLYVIVSQSDERPLDRMSRAHRALRGLNVETDIFVKTRAEFDFFRPVYASLECQAAELGRMLYDRSQTKVSAELAYQSAP